MDLFLMSWDTSPKITMVALETATLQLSGQPKEMETGGNTDFIAVPEIP